MERVINYDYYLIKTCPRMKNADCTSCDLSATAEHSYIQGIRTGKNAKKENNQRYGRAAICQLDLCPWMDLDSGQENELNFAFF